MIEKVSPTKLWLSINIKWCVILFSSAYELMKKRGNKSANFYYEIHFPPLSFSYISNTNIFDVLSPLYQSWWVRWRASSFLFATRRKSSKDIRPVSSWKTIRVKITDNVVPMSYSQLYPCLIPLPLPDHWSQKSS